MSGSDKHKDQDLNEQEEMGSAPKADAKNAASNGEDKAKASENKATNASASSPEEAAEADLAATAQIKALEEEVEKQRDAVLRARAEVENVLRRTEREKQDISAYAISGFARDLLAVSDNLRRALDHLPEKARDDDSLKGFIEGVEMTERELLNTLERHGIKRIEPKGEKFDHNFHQAMAEVETDNHPPGTVVDVYQAGYVIKDRLLRPAMVTVAKNGEKKPVEGVDTTV